jgi:hypothetical protein
MIVLLMILLISTALPQTRGPPSSKATPRESVPTTRGGRTVLLKSDGTWGRPVSCLHEDVPIL